ncbi:unnamed protein product [Kuraishia capsulata CBS 1993]|uniref:DNA-directed RNA polymerase III subunit n=1 Tax=Kuraishia capsulata CBS 1993 TaxID=1382522 RepID=W6MH88_9ASCO|nr:uncharacterized protein KUCA_T00001290001 [Kuraishia capsulata CBS 1993]CDK25321.1 unnamed protein product [Kuraishia capsulata CBS 1993]
MSFRGGRAGGSRSLLPFGLDYHDIKKTGEDEPLKYPLPVNSQMTQKERDSAKHLINFTKLMRDGPFYTGKLDSVDSDKSNKKAEKDANYYEGGINDGIKRYSDRYRKKRKTVRSIDDHPYIIQFFPDELLSVMGVDNSKKKKLLSISRYKISSDPNFGDLIKKSEDKSSEIMSRLQDVEEDTTTNQEVENDEDVEEDDEFEEDEDDDYNAEKYFDDGDDDGRDDDDGGDEAAF